MPHRRHVGLGPGRPVHLDVRRPRRDGEVPAQAEPGVARGGDGQAEAAPERGVQAVGGDEVARPHLLDPHAGGRPGPRRGPPAVPVVRRPPARPWVSSACRSVRRIPRPGPWRKSAVATRSPAAYRTPQARGPAGRRRGRGGRRGRRASTPSAAGLVDRAAARVPDLDLPPRARACSAVARPAGPPPATRRSTARRCSRCRRHLQRALLDPDPDPQQRGVERR